MCFFCFLLCINRSGLEFTIVLLLFPVSSRLFMSFDSVSDKPDRVLLFILFFCFFLLFFRKIKSYWSDLLFSANRIVIISIDFGFVLILLFSIEFGILLGRVNTDDPLEFTPLIVTDRFLTMFQATMMQATVSHNSGKNSLPEQCFPCPVLMSLDVRRTSGSQIHLC